MRESEDEFEKRLQEQRNSYEAILNEIKLRIDTRLERFDPSQAKKELQDFVFKVSDERQKDSFRQLVDYMQELMKM